MRLNQVISKVVAGFCMCLSHIAHSQPVLSSEAYISLLTCSPGKMLYEAFGHSAFRVHDPEKNVDITFNFGTFDFDQPGFYSNYAKGRPVFTLSIAPTRFFINSYVRDNRSVFEDVLNLDQNEKQELFNLLQENYLPQNRDYVYDYIYDNCSTRLRDIIEKLFEGRVIFDANPSEKQYSFRELMDLYVRHQQPWGDFAIDLALGSEIDAKATPYQYMFLPDFLQAGFRSAMINKEGAEVKLVKNSKVIFEAKDDKQEKVFITPAMVFWIVFILFVGITLLEMRKNDRYVLPDVLLFAGAGLAGILVAYISFFSDHHARGNYNLLWAMPTHVIIALMLPFAKWKFIRVYFLAIAILSIMLLIGSYAFLPQKMHFTLIPVILTIVLRGAWIFYRKY